MWPRCQLARAKLASACAPCSACAVLQAASRPPPPYFRARSRESGFPALSACSWSASESCVSNVFPRTGRTCMFLRIGMHRISSAAPRPPAPRDPLRFKLARPARARPGRPRPRVCLAVLQARAEAAAARAPAAARPGSGPPPRPRPCRPAHPRHRPARGPGCPSASSCVSPSAGAVGGGSPGPRWTWACRVSCRRPAHGPAGPGPGPATR